MRHLTNISHKIFDQILNEPILSSDAFITDAKDSPVNRVILKFHGNITLFIEAYMRIMDEKYRIFNEDDFSKFMDHPNTIKKITFVSKNEEGTLQEMVIEFQHVLPFTGKKLILQWDISHYRNNQRKMFLDFNDNHPFNIVPITMTLATCNMPHKVETYFN